MKDKKVEFIGKKIKFPVVSEIGRGLENAIVTNTLIGYIDGEKGKLYYRGIAIEELAENSTFEETSYLLINGKLPNLEELKDFTNKLKKYREVPEKVIENLKRLPVDMPAMNMLSTGINMLAGYDIQAMNEITVENETEVSIKIIAKIATLTAAIARIKENKEIIIPDSSLSHAANLLYMITGEKPDDFSERAMNTTLIIHMDHGLNASTFTSLAIHSGLSDMYSSIAGSIGCLKGLLHGGANERVIHTLREIGSAEKADNWYRNQRRLKRRIYGFGHRVYRAYDPRARLLRDFILTFCLDDENINLCNIAEKIEKLAEEDLGKKGIFPNVDWRSGQVYLYLGIPVYLFTPLFAVGRVVGWTARILEYMAENRILRPRAHYYGPLDVKYIPIEDR